MQNFIIKTHRVGTIYTKPHLFVLNKGMNSGKPQKEPFTNSFVIIFQNEDDCENLFFIAYSLWQTKFWHQYLVGSVIPFLRLPDFKKQFNPQANLMMVEHEQHQKNIAALKLLEKKEKQYRNSRKIPSGEGGKDKRTMQTSAEDNKQTQSHKRARSTTSSQLHSTGQGANRETQD